MIWMDVARMFLALLVYLAVLGFGIWAVRRMSRRGPPEGQRHG
jgi:flagellar biogenesis protein FliO